MGALGLEGTPPKVHPEMGDAILVRLGGASGIPPPEAKNSLFVRIGWNNANIEILKAPDM
jgi:hypothetical protein